MPVPAKPTARLVVDGVIGKKTRDAAAYAFSVNSFTNGTTVGTLGPERFRENLQRWLNKQGYWKKLIEDDRQDEWWNKNLGVDGKWGPLTRAKLGGSIAYLSGPHASNRIAEGDAQTIGNDIRAFQTLLNGIIFREKPTGRTCYTAQTKIKLLTSGTGKWGRTPAARWTGTGAQ